jgi:hypothetical protein
MAYEGDSPYLSIHGTATNIHIIYVMNNYSRDLNVHS